MKDLDARIYAGGDDAIAAACELAGLAKERRGYDAVNSATSDITDIVTVLRGVGFAAVPSSAGDSASLLHYCVTHAADEIERLRLLSGDGDCSEPDNGTNEDTVGRTLARRITRLQPMLECREQIAILQSDNNRRADLEAGLREGVEQLQGEVRRLEAVIAARDAEEDAEGRVSLQNETPSIGENPTLTDKERAAVEWAVAAASDCEHPAEDTLRSLLERRAAGFGDDEWV